MNLLHRLKRLFISEDGTTKEVEYLVMMASLVILCVSIFRVVNTLR